MTSGTKVPLTVDANPTAIGFVRLLVNGVNVSLTPSGNAFSTSFTGVYIVRELKPAGPFQISLSYTELATQLSNERFSIFTCSRARPVCDLGFFRDPISLVCALASNGHPLCSCDAALKALCALTKPWGISQTVPTISPWTITPCHVWSSSLTLSN